MAKTEQEIVFNYRKTIRQALELEDIASGIKKIGNSKMTNSLSKVSKNWTGGNADAYTKKGNKLNGKVEKSSNDINMAASTLKSMAQNIYNAEMASLREIQMRSQK